MRLIATLLPALAAAQAAQQPLGERVQGWFEKAKTFLPQTAQGPIDAGASTVAAHQVTPLTTSNWATVLAPQWHEESASFGPDNWMVLVTGQNRTCQGRCGQIEAEFNKTAALFSADKDAPQLAVLDCDNARVLCSTWFAGPPTVWYIEFPQHAPGEAHKTPVHVFALNTTTTTAASFVSIHKDKKYLAAAPMDSYFHPWDGVFAQNGLNKPIGYALFLFSMIPSWSLMLAVSFFTRSLM